MRLLSVFAVAVSLVFTLVAAAPAGTNLAGTWKGSMETQVGTMEVKITFEPGEAIADTVEGGDYKGQIEKAMRDRDMITFQVSIAPGTLGYHAGL